MKKLVLTMALALSVASLSACGAKTEAPAENGAAVEPTTLVGTADGFNGPIEVKVTKEGDKITAVEITKNEESTDRPEIQEALDTLPGAIVEANGTEGVEVVSGATYTSEGIINAVNAAE